MICLYIKKVVFSDTIIEIFGCRVFFWVGFSSTEWFGTAFQEIIYIFCCTERNSELCSLLRNRSEWNSENLHLFWFHGTKFRVVFSSVEGFGTELWEFASIFVPRNGIPSYFSSAEGFGTEFRDFLFRGTTRAGIFTKSMGARHRGGIGFSYRPARLHRLAEFIPWNQCRGPINI